MKVKQALWSIGLCALLPGCTLVARSARNLAFETSMCLDNTRSQICTRRQATEAWNEVAASNAMDQFSEDYARGFKEGFADYVDYGGTGEPPALPPRRYWKSDYQTAEGHQAITDWFAGFRHGAQVARDSGLRELVVVPVSAAPPAAPPLPVVPDAIEAVPGPIPGPAPVVEPELPAPRPLMPPARDTKAAPEAAPAQPAKAPLPPPPPVAARPLPMGAPTVVSRPLTPTKLPEVVVAPPKEPDSDRHPDLLPPPDPPSQADTAWHENRASQILRTRTRTQEGQDTKGAPDDAEWHRSKDGADGVIWIEK